MARGFGKGRWALALGVAVTVLGAWLALAGGGDAAATAEARAAGATAAAAGVVPAAASPSSASTNRQTAASDQHAAPAPDAVPAGLSAAQWQQMQAALADHPQREAELRRITAFLQLQQRVQAFADARQRGAARSELAALARPLQAKLPQHLALGELTAAEALRLQAALVEVTEPDAAAAAQALADWRARHLGRQADTAANEARALAFAQAQQTALANWQAGGGRDPQALEHELEILRSAHFDARR